VASGTGDIVRGGSVDSVRGGTGDVVRGDAVQQYVDHLGCRQRVLTRESRVAAGEGEEPEETGAVVRVDTERVLVPGQECRKSI